MRHKSKKSNADKLAGVNIAIAKAKLAKLEGEAPPPAVPEYTRYEDLPPLHPEDRDRLEQKLIKMLTVDEEAEKRKKHDWYMSMAHFAP